ncbi:hypothetical protein ES702_07287 [subsurface metagenome]
MDKFIQERFDRLERKFQTPFIYNVDSDFILQQTGGDGLYYLFEIDLSTARINKKFTWRGDRLLILDCEASASMRLNNTNNSLIDLTKIRKIKAPMREFYITNSASAGNYLRILAGSKGMFEIDYDLETALDTLETTLETIYARQNETIIDKITPVPNDFQSADQSGSAGVIWNPTAGKKWVLSDIIISSDTALTLEFDDGTALFLKLYLSANGGAVSNFRVPIVSATADNDLTVQTSGAGNISITTSGWEI